jgi:hypothetical protein
VVGVVVQSYKVCGAFEVGNVGHAFIYNDLRFRGGTQVGHGRWDTWDTGET